MANEVYRPYGYRWACLYDTRDYTAQTLRQVRQVHPQLLQPAGRARRNGQYLEPSRYVTQAEPLVRPPAAVQLDFEVTDPGELLWGRRLLRGWAEIRGMGGEDTDDVLIAIGEAVTNAVEHGTPPVRVRAWTADGLARVHVHDHGTTPIPATAGYRRPHHEFDRGYGLWVARQLADVVTTYSDPAGTTIALDVSRVSSTHRAANVSTRSAGREGALSRGRERLLGAGRPSRALVDPSTGTPVPRRSRVTRWPPRPARPGHSAVGASTTAMWLPSGSRIMNSRGAPRVRTGSGSTSMPRALNRRCSARTSGVSTPIPPPPGCPPIGGLSASRAREPGGATSSQRYSSFSPNRVSPRTSKPSLSV
jgi:anti-sigma regulatory factor (Ser/Thr protein kinase)